MIRRYKDFSQKLLDATGHQPLITSNFVTRDTMLSGYEDLYVHPNAYPLHLAGKNGLGMMFSQDPQYIKYLLEQGLIQNLGNIIQIGENKDPKYPYGSVEAEFLNLPILKQQEIKKQIHRGDFALFSNFITPDTLNIAKILDIPHGNIALSEQKNAKKISKTSHSKDFLRKNASQYGYEIPLGRTIEQNGSIISFEYFKEIILGLQGEAKEEYKLNDEEVTKLEYWFKFDSLSGGDGTINIKAPLTDEEILNALKEVKNIALKCGMDLSNFPMPLVLEVGANSIPGKEILGNINMQGIIGNGSYLDLLQVSGQKTDKNGNYLGNILPFGTPDLQNAVKESFAKVCNAFRDIGYRGIIGGDAIVSQDANKNFHVEWFDLNPRINGSTPFQEQYDMLAEVHNNLVGMNRTLTLDISTVNFQYFREKIEQLLFNKKQKLLGIIPVTFNPNHPITASIFAKSQEGMNNTLQAIQELGIKV